MHSAGLERFAARYPQAFRRLRCRDNGAGVASGLSFQGLQVMQSGSVQIAVTSSAADMRPRAPRGYSVGREMEHLARGPAPLCLVSMPGSSVAARAASTRRCSRVARNTQGFQFRLAHRTISRFFSWSSLTFASDKLASWIRLACDVVISLYSPNVPTISVRC